VQVTESESYLSSIESSAVFGEAFHIREVLIEFSSSAGYAELTG